MCCILNWRVEQAVKWGEEGAYAWETKQFERIYACLSLPLYGILIAGKKFIFCSMSLLMTGSIPGPVHLLFSPNQWHHRKSMTCLFLIAAATTAVTSALGGIYFCCIYTAYIFLSPMHTFKHFPNLEELPSDHQDCWTLLMPKCLLFLILWRL